ncbi:lipase class 3 family protein [Dendrothele bispora CBS 962.96]|uniref:Lipase class 3 family protein n=1 Tax=Dendrothele bispora (strain CBS 962.96) TaxID=1314807 RepID=A0A4S8MHK7_DENBC|nr:lipase class 3 family protein [Dendrothele bispora CBS 962.96]
MVNQRALLALPSLLAVLGSSASPLIARQAITALSTSQISTFKPFSFFAAAAYCDPSTTKAWNCGLNCQSNADFITTASGGDGDAVQFWYVGFSPSQKTVIVAHQGTDTSEFEALLTDSEFVLEPLDSSLFPGVSSSIETHNGFAAEQAKTATTILSAVQTTLTAHSVNSVTLVGHSLGAAISLLDSIYLPLHLPSGTTFRSVLYGLPRVGNPAFADYVDAHASVTHINNKEDVVPILPGKFLGFAHPNGEVHIQDSGAWDVCPGHDNSDDRCSTGDVGNIFEGSISDHDGPYDGVEMGGSGCS